MRASLTSRRLPTWGTELEDEEEGAKSIGGWQLKGFTSGAVFKNNAFNERCVNLLSPLLSTPGEGVFNGPRFIGFLPGRKALTIVDELH